MSATSSLRGRWRRLALGLPTVLGLKPRGWFIPHRYAPLLPPPGAQPPYPAIERLFAETAGTFTGVLDAVDAAPRADIIDLPGVRVVPSTLQAAPADLFNVLKAGDALFIDSSH